MVAPEYIQRSTEILLIYIALIGMNLILHQDNDPKLQQNIKFVSLYFILFYSCTLKLMFLYFYLPTNWVLCHQQHFVVSCLKHHDVNIRQDSDLWSYIHLFLSRTQTSSVYHKNNRIAVAVRTSRADCIGRVER